MFRLEGNRPNDQRAFLHKKLLGLGSGIIKRAIGATPVGQAISTISGFLPRKPRATVSRFLTARPSVAGERGKDIGRALKFGDSVGPGVEFRPQFVNTRRFRPVPSGLGGITIGEPCAPGTVEAEVFGRKVCVAPCSPVGRTAGLCREGGGGGGGGGGGAPVGDAVMGQYGAALEPGVMQIERSVCLPGMQLAKDGLCYNKGAITNSQRMWPRGRRPLLTGGDMRAIGIAARAGAKLERTTKRLQGLGMMKKPVRRIGPGRQHQHAKALPAVSIS